MRTHTHTNKRLKLISSIRGDGGWIRKGLENELVYLRLSMHITDLFCRSFFALLDYFAAPSPVSIHAINFNGRHAPPTACSSSSIILREHQIAPGDQRRVDGIILWLVIYIQFQLTNSSTESQIFLFASKASFVSFLIVRPVFLQSRRNFYCGR